MISSEDAAHACMHGESSTYEHHAYILRTYENEFSENAPIRFNDFEG